MHFRLRRAAVSLTDKSRKNGTLPAVASEKASYPSTMFAVIPLIIELIRLFLPKTRIFFKKEFMQVLGFTGSSRLRFLKVACTGFR